MLSGWWIDALALALMLLAGLLVWRMERGAVTQAPGRPAPSEQPRLRGYARVFRQAGFHPELIMHLFWAAKLCLAVLTALVIFEVQTSSGLAAALGGALLGFFVPDLFMLARRQQRRQRITHTMPFLISLLAVYLRSGLSLNQALRQASQLGQDGDAPLAQELALICREIEAGRDRDLAFASLAERTGVKDTDQLAAVIHVGYQAGAPIADTLDAQARSLRDQQAQQVTQLVQRKSMELMLPMLLVCFPMFIVIVLFPAAVQLFDVLDMISELF